MSGWEYRNLEYNRNTYMKQLACVTCLLQKKQVSMKTNNNQGINKNCKNKKMKINCNKVNKQFNHYPSLLGEHTKQKGLQTNDTPIWIVTNVFLLAILFNLHHAPSVWIHRTLRLWWQQLLSLPNPLFPALCLLKKFKNHAFLYFIETLCMHSKLAISYSTTQPPYASINYCFSSPSFHL